MGSEKIDCGQGKRGLKRKTGEQVMGRLRGGRDSARNENQGRRRQGRTKAEGQQDARGPADRCCRQETLKSGGQEGVGRGDLRSERSRCL